MKNTIKALSHILYERKSGDLKYTKYIKRKEEGATQPIVVAPKMGMTSFWADGGVLPVSGVTEWVINGNEGTTEEGLFLVFSYVCLVFSTGEQIVLIKYSGNCIIGNAYYLGKHVTYST